MEDILEMKLRKQLANWQVSKITPTSENYEDEAEFTREPNKE